MSLANQHGLEIPPLDQGSQRPSNGLSIQILILILLLVIPGSAYAALININTADAALLDSLPGIGATKAQAIIDYRTVNGPFARIEDIQNVSGIGASTYAQIAPLITVGTSAPIATTTEMATPTPSMPSVYIPPPSSLLIEAGSDQKVYQDVRTMFSALVTTKSGAEDGTAHVYWSFGDGSGAEGFTAEKTFRYPGSYAVSATALDGSVKVRDTFVVTVVPLVLRIADITDAGISIANDTADQIDLSAWRLTSGAGVFRFPLGTLLLAHATILFPFAVTNLPVAYDATLSFPDGVEAARYAPPDVRQSDIVQPSVTTESFPIEQRLAPAVTSDVTEGAYDARAVEASAETSTLAAAGAALDESRDLAGSTKKPYWLYGLISVALLAGSVFVFL